MSAMTGHIFIGFRSGAQIVSIIGMAAALAAKWRAAKESGASDGFDYDNDNDNDNDNDGSTAGLSYAIGFIRGHQAL